MDLPLTQQIQTWFRWHGATNCNTRKNPGLKHLKAFTEGASKRTRNAHESEVYSELFYKSRIKPEVAKILLTRSKDNKDYKSFIMKTITSTTRSMWDNEDDATKALVAATIAERLAKATVAKDEATVNELLGIGERTAEEYQG